MIGIILRIDFEQIGVIVAAKEKNKMLHAMFKLVILTTVIMVLTTRTRIESVKSGVVPQNYYSLMQGHDIPDFVAKTTRNFNNYSKFRHCFMQALPCIWRWIRPGEYP